MKTLKELRLLLSLMSIALGVLIGMNDSQLCFPFILAGIIGIMYCVRIQIK